MIARRGRGHDQHSAAAQRQAACSASWVLAQSRKMAARHLPLLCLGQSCGTSTPCALQQAQVACRLALVAETAAAAPAMAVAGSPHAWWPRLLPVPALLVQAAAGAAARCPPPPPLPSCLPHVAAKRHQECPGAALRWRAGLRGRRPAAQAPPACAQPGVRRARLSARHPPGWLLLLAAARHLAACWRGAHSDAPGCQPHHP